jgi:GNAT superfamily N-acetyltransferase
MTTVAGATIRRATVEDIPTIRRILAAHDNDGPVAPEGRDIVGPYVRHFVDHHRALVTELDGSVVAYGAVLDTGRVRMLAELFVEPGRLGTGLGRPLLAELFQDTRARATFASSDPRALPLYVRAGMTPLWSGFYVEGEASRVPAGDPTLTLWDAAATELALLEEAWTGAARSVDHEYWSTLPDGDAFIVEDAEGPAAFGYGRAKQDSATRDVERLLVRPGADPVGPILAGLARVARGGRVHACVFGPNPILPILLEAGFRIVDRDQYLASDRDLVDPARLVFDPGML